MDRQTFSIWLENLSFFKDTPKTHINTIGTYLFVYALIYNGM